MFKKLNKSSWPLISQFIIGVLIEVTGYLIIEIIKNFF